MLSNTRDRRAATIPTAQGRSGLSRRLSKRKWHLRETQSLPPPRDDDDDELDAQEAVPYRPGSRTKPRELNAETEKMTRESLELERTLSEWGADCSDLHEETAFVSKEHAKSTGVRGFLRSDVSRRLHAEKEYRTAKDIHRSYIDTSERTIQDAFLAGNMTLDQYERSLEHLRQSHRLPPSPKNPPTSFRVTRRPTSYASDSYSTCSASMSSIDLTAAAAPQRPRPPALRSHDSSGTILPYPSQKKKSTFYVANPSPDSSTSDLGEMREL